MFPGFLMLIVAATMMLFPGQTIAEEIRVAVASNFADAITSIARRFEATTNHKVTLIFGSTGKLYAQVKNGAPFDAFFAADVRRPELLEEESVALPGSRLTYAAGKVVLWSPETVYVDPEGRILEQGEFRYLAIANPGLALYGKAARDMLTRLDLPLAHGSDAEALIEATVAGHDDEYELTYMDFAGGRFTVTRKDLTVGSNVRLRVAARDVSLTLEHQSGTSILNIFPATVEEITGEGAAQVMVRLLLGSVPMLARVTRKSASVLDLKPGRLVYVQAKSVALLS